MESRSLGGRLAPHLLSQGWSGLQNQVSFSSIPYAKISEKTMWKKKKKTTQEKGKKKSKKQPTKNFCLWIQKSPLHARFIYIKLVMTFQVSLRLKCLLDHLKLLSRAPATLLTWRAGLLRV